VARYSRGAVSSRRTSALARGAVAFAEETDMLNAPADALIDFAEVLALAGQDAEAEPEQALAHYERKGNLVMVDHAMEAGGAHRVPAGRLLAGGRKRRGGDR
jgi:hypothetical protein